MKTSTMYKAIACIHALSYGHGTLDICGKVIVMTAIFIKDLVGVDEIRDGIQSNSRSQKWEIEQIKWTIKDKHTCRYKGAESLL